MKKHRDCDHCRLTVIKECAECAGTGSVPCAPPVGETVLYWPPLEGYFAEAIASGELAVSDLVASYRPLIVTDAVYTRRGNEVGLYVEVSGWVLARSQRLRRPSERQVAEEARWVDGLGWVIPAHNMRPSMRFLEGIRGPKDAPGHWTWRKDPA